MDATRALQPSPVPLLRQAESIERLDLAHRRGEVRRVAHGVYAPSAMWDALAPWDRYLARVHAHALKHPDAVFCLESAAALLGIPVIGSPSEVHVVSAQTAGRRIGDVRFHVTSDRREVVSASGLLLLSPEDTAVDLARARHPAVGLAAVDGTLRMLGLDDPGVLVELNESRASGRGRAAARWSLGRATALAETALESLSRAVIEWLGYPDPELQVTFPSRHGREHRADLYWRARRIIGETDGRIKYDGTFGHDTRRLWREKRREDELRRASDGFARWGWPEASDPPVLDDLLLQAGLRHVRPPVSAPLRSLSAALRGR
ncbi:hypothetical protein [Microbacterium marinilacus]|nr:hypothetical protein [Microbacterium marinilacus]MBY0689809.1 hypothetical protein [Microbacterium marinilacus]